MDRNGFFSGVWVDGNFQRFSSSAKNAEIFDIPPPFIAIGRLYTFYYVFMKIDVKNFLFICCWIFLCALSFFSHLCVMSCKSTCENIPLLLLWMTLRQKISLFVGFTLLRLRVCSWWLNLGWIYGFKAVTFGSVLCGEFWWTNLC